MGIVTIENEILRDRLSDIKSAFNEMHLEATESTKYVLVPLEKYRELKEVICDE